MKTLAFMAIACMSMWISGDANAQRPEKGSSDAQQQSDVEGRSGKRGRRGMRGQRGEQGKRGQRGGKEMLEGMFSRFDADKNGSISLDEAPERMKQRFEKLDANGDSSVSMDELTAAMGNMRGGKKGGEAGGKGKGRGAEGKGKGQGKRNGGQMDPAKMMEKMDTNKDGGISLDEAPERMKKRFEQMDADQNGTVTAEEFKAAIGKMKNRKGNGAAGRDKSGNPEDKLPKQPKRPPMAEEGA